MLPGEGAVHVHVGPLVRALEVEEDALPLQRVVEGDGAAIPPDAAVVARPLRREFLRSDMQDALKADRAIRLAADFNARVEAMKGDFGEIGDTRLTVMAGIAVLDELGEAHRTIEGLRKDIAELTTAGRELTLEAEEMEQKFARRLADAARKVEAIATAIDETGSPTAP